MENPYQAPAQPNTNPLSECVDLEKSKNRFRQLLIASIAISIIGLPVSLISERFLPDPLISYVDSQMEQEMSIVDIVFIIPGLSFIFIFLWNFIQLFRFNPSSRPIAIVLTILGLLAWLFFDPIVESQISRVFSDTSALLWGAAMAMMYCQPYSKLFLITHQNKTPTKNN